MDPTLDTWTTKLTEALTNFVAISDLNTVIMIVLLTGVLRVTVWRLFVWPEHLLNFAPLLLSVFLTPVLSTTPELEWGRGYYLRSILYNAGVALMFWAFVVPQLRQRWPKIFKVNNNATP